MQPPQALLRLDVPVPEAANASSPGHLEIDHPSADPALRRHNRWFRTAFYIFLVLCCQPAAVLLGRLYFNKGGKSKWMSTLVQVAGFPILLPLFCISGPENGGPDERLAAGPRPSSLLVASVYVSLGLLNAGNCILYSVGLDYLPVSTLILIGSSTLGFNALFSYPLNSQKFTPFIVNSLVLLTISSALLVFQTDSTTSSEASKRKYPIGFICTLAAAAGSALVLSLTQVAYRKVFKSEDFKVIVKMAFYQTLVGSCVVLVGLFASGEWKGLKREMEEFQLGRVSYLMTLIWTAVNWQVFQVGAVGLIFEMSSLFCNVISALSLPIAPVFAAVFFHEKMTGVKAVSMVLAIWGFLSYIYQHYLDEHKAKDGRGSGSADQVAAAPSPDSMNGTC